MYSLENNRTEGRTITITSGKLCEVPHLQSNRKYRFILRRANSEDIIGNPTIKETAGELLNVFFPFRKVNCLLDASCSFKGHHVFIGSFVFNGNVTKKKKKKAEINR